MELRQLRYLRAAAETGTFTAAAEREHVAQPALWKQVRDLERELGVTMFERTGRRVRLTEHGRLVVGAAAQVLESADRLRGLAEDLRRGRTGQVVIACSPPHINRVLADAVRAYGVSHPGVHVALREYPGAGAPPVPEPPFLGELRAGLADLAIAGGPAPGLESLLLYRVAAVILVADDHPWRRRAVVKVEELRDVPLTVTPDGFTSRRLLERACRAAGFDPLVERVAGSPFSIVAMATRGAGIAIVADDVAPPAAPPWPRLEARNVVMGEDVHLHWRPVAQPEAVTAFIETVRRIIG